MRPPYPWLFPTFVCVWFAFGGGAGLMSQSVSVVQPPKTQASSAAIHLHHNAVPHKLLSGVVLSGHKVNALPSSSVLKMSAISLNLPAPSDPSVTNDAEVCAAVALYHDYDCAYYMATGYVMATWHWLGCGGVSPCQPSFNIYLVPPTFHFQGSLLTAARPLAPPTPSPSPLRNFAHVAIAVSSAKPATVKTSPPPSAQPLPPNIIAKSQLVNVAVLNQPFATVQLRGSGNPVGDLIKGLKPGECFDVTALNGGVESAPSDTYCIPSNMRLGATNVVLHPAYAGTLWEQQGACPFGFLQHDPGSIVIGYFTAGPNAGYCALYTGAVKFDLSSIHTFVLSADLQYTWAGNYSWDTVPNLNSGTSCLNTFNVAKNDLSGAGDFGYIIPQTDSYPGPFYYNSPFNYGATELTWTSNEVHRWMGGIPAEAFVLEWEPNYLPSNPNLDYCVSEYTNVQLALLILK